MGQIILWPMKKETDIRRGRHCVFLKHVHLVFVTKYRRQIFDHDATEKLRTYFSNVCADFEAERVEMDGGPDHVHLLINYPLKWFTEFGHLNRGDMLTSEQHRCHNEKKKFQRRV